MLQTKLRMSVTEFEAFIRQSEQLEQGFEYVGGEVVAVVSNNYSSEIAALIMTYLGVYLLANKLGRLTGADGGYVIGGERYIPDVAYISFEKQPQPSRDAYNPNPPDLAVEVLSPTNDDEKMRVKVTNYLYVGTIVWAVDPLSRTVEVYEPDKPVVILTDADTLTLESILPNFELPVRNIFPIENSE